MFPCLYVHVFTIGRFTATSQSRGSLINALLTSTGANISIKRSSVVYSDMYQI